MKYFIQSILIILCTSFFVSCDSKKPKRKIVAAPQKETPSLPTIVRPTFDGDSAYQYVVDQVTFGPRVPGTVAHNKCATYLKNKLSQFGLSTQIQQTTAKTFNGNIIDVKNIIGSYLPDNKKRILLFAHWDSRPFADQAKENRTVAISGANDGASGVGILLEVARQLQITTPNIGVDIIFFDAEDYGQPSSGMQVANNDTWCIGSRYWAKNPHTPDYKAEFGILLDMVGNANPLFTKEGISMKYAPHIVNNVWKIAHALGYQQYFSNKETHFVGTDDHQPINEIAGIPSIDIIHFEESRGSFHHSWHTHNDNIDVINKTSLQLVGETLLAVLQKNSIK